MPLEKPTSVADLEPPFRKIGEPNWDLNLKKHLVEYGVPLPIPVDIRELTKLESVLNFELDPSLRTFLLTIGPLDFNSLRILGLNEIRLLHDFWPHSDSLVKEHARLINSVATIDYLDSGDLIAWDRKENNYVLVRQSPARIQPWLPSFDDCIREQCVSLASGYYGWPDPDVESLVHKVKKEMFPTLGLF